MMKSQSTNEIRASIIIRTYNERTHIAKLMYGIWAQTEKSYEIVVVDSGSTDGTPEIAAKLGATIVHIPKAEFSFGRSLNYGCRAARGEFLVIVSAHCYPVHNHWLSDLLEPFADPTIGLVYGKQRGCETSKFSEHQIFRAWFPDTDEIPQDHCFCNNANAAVRRSEWQQRPYDEDLTGLEDLNWAKQAAIAGLKVAYKATATVVHVHDESWAQVRNRYYREALAFAVIEPKARFSAWDFTRLLVSNVVSDLLVAARTGQLRKTFGEVLRFRWYQFSGAYHARHLTREEANALKRRFYYPTQDIGETDDDRPRIDYAKAHLHLLPNIYEAAPHHHHVPEPMKRAISHHDA